MAKFKEGDILKYNKKYLTEINGQEHTVGVKIRITEATNYEYTADILVGDDYNFYDEENWDEDEPEENYTRFTGTWIDTWMEKSQTIESFVEDKLKQHGFIK